MKRSGEGEGREEEKGGERKGEEKKGEEGRREGRGGEEGLVSRLQIFQIGGQKHGSGFDSVAPKGDDKTRTMELDTLGNSFRLDLGKDILKIVSSSLLHEKRSEYWQVWICSTCELG